MYCPGNKYGNLAAPLLAKISRPSAFLVIIDKRADLKNDLLQSFHFFTGFYEHLCSSDTLGNKMAVVGLPFKKKSIITHFKTKNSSDIMLQSSKKEKGRLLDMSGLQYIYLKIHKI